MKLWMNENEFIDLQDRESLLKEIAPRSRSFDWMGIMGFLPDPDPVLRKLGQDITIYRQLLSDAHVWSCYQSRKSGVLSCEWEVSEQAGGSVRANRRAHQMIQEVMNGLDVYQIMTDMLDAPFFGMSPLEVLWISKSEISGWIPMDIVGRPPEWFAFDSENRLRFKSKENMIEGEELPEYKFLLPRHHASYQNPYGERILSRCFWPVAFKKGGFKFWAIFTEKYGMPWLVGKVPRSTNETERAALLTRLTSMVQDAAAVINDDESVEITEASGKKASADIYEGLIKAANREISKAVLGQTLSTELDKGGSYAATKGHLEVRADLVDQDKRMVCQAFNTLFRWIGELNWTDATAPAFAFYEEEDIQKERAERDKVLSEQGVKFTKPYYQRVYNLEEGDFELSEAKPEDESSKQKKEFAEGDEDISMSSETITKRAISEASMDELIEPAKALLSQAGSLDEFRDGLIDLYGDMDETSFGNLMQQALLLADLAGRFDANA